MRSTSTASFAPAQSLKFACATLLLGAAISAHAQYVSPTPYTSFAGSPFSSVSFNYFHLENFEDGLLNTPGVVASAGVPVSFGSDSVSGGAWTFYSNGTNSLNFTFNAAALGGQLPTHVGLVWADVGIATPTYGFGNVQFEAFDASSTSLGVFGPFAVGDGSNAFGTTEDRFLGIVNAPGGIKSIRVTMPGSTDWELDHLQYGAVAVPEPSAIGLVAFGCGALFVNRRR
jgi:hypothetical protein